ncbi:MAG: exodeoxyribonuclease VII large subunit [Hydrogenoanaerobacterium sp.]
MLNGNLLTVSQLNRYVKALFEDNKQLSGLLLKGEISNLSNHFSSGHVYFSLKDEGASVKAIMFKTYAKELKFTPKNGQKVIVSCSVSVYERDGIYQLYVYDMQPDGVGALALGAAQLKEKLAAEGLFAQEHKLLLPYMPRVIGVVTSKTGAALQDILNVLGRRYPVATVLVAPVTVQGERAADEIVSALQMLNQKLLCDVIILGRGGGAEEDLQAFNNERLVRAVYASVIPVISAVGHETDYTLTDFAADKRAPTPSAAAELAVPELTAIYERLLNLNGAMHDNINMQLDRLFLRLSYCQKHRALQSPTQLLAIKSEHLIKLKQALSYAMQNKIEQSQADIANKSLLLNSLSPLNVLARGYSITFLNKTPLTNALQVKNGQAITIKLAKGTLRAQVTEATEE